MRYRGCWSARSLLRAMIVRRAAAVTKARVRGLLQWRNWTTASLVRSRDPVVGTKRPIDAEA